MAERFLPTGLPVARQAPPPLPSQRDLERFGDRGRRESGARTVSGRTAGDLGDDLRGAPVGEWVEVISTWVYRTRFDPTGEKVGDWHVEFLDGAWVKYPNTPASLFADLLNSSSKGLFIGHHCKQAGRPYVLLRGTQRRVSARARKIRDVVGPGRPESRRHAPRIG